MPPILRRDNAEITMCGLKYDENGQLIDGETAYSVFGRLGSATRKFVVGSRSSNFFHVHSAKNRL